MHTTIRFWLLALNRMVSLPIVSHIARESREDRRFSEQNQRKPFVVGTAFFRPGIEPTRSIDKPLLKWYSLITFMNSFLKPLSKAA
jgi:hypothetical protein